MNSEIEGRLYRALAPVEPPPSLYGRVEAKLEHASTSAAAELHDWELSAMKDPRNWVRPVVAVVVGGGAGAALVVMHTRRRRAAKPVQRKLLLGKSGIKRR